MEYFCIPPLIFVQGMGIFYTFLPTPKKEETEMENENLYTFENPEYRKTFWHTSSHVMARL